MFTTEVFDTTQMTVDRDDTDNTITFTMHTMFDGSDLGAYYADLFFDTSTPNTPDTFGYAITLGDQGMPAGVYQVGQYSTPNDIWGAQSTYVYGGYIQFKTTSPDYDPTMAIAPPVRLDSGTQLSDYTVTTTQTNDGNGFFDVSVVVAAASNLNLFDDFDVLWGTADCGNDAIWGTVETAPVDAPAGLGLLAVGILGLLGLGAGKTRRMQMI